MYQQILYDIIIRAYGIGIRLAAPFKKKATQWVRGRYKWQARLAHQLGTDSRPVIWIHAASLGEFEQGRPVIDLIHTRFPGHRILLTFFSPSGYEIRKGYDKADIVAYLPLDTHRNAKRFIELTSPVLAIFIKYEFWFNHLAQLKKNKVRTILISGRLYASQGFFKPWGGFFRKGLETFDHFFVQDEESADLLMDIGFDNYTVNGDTRFDRVMDIRSEEVHLPKVSEFCSGHPTIVLGSSWPNEEILMSSFIQNNQDRTMRLVIAPHEIHDGRIDDFEKNSSAQVLRLSQWEQRSGEETVLFIDSIGLLAQVYRYASVAFIGGGFGAGIHNCLEAAVWARPVIFGPRYKMFKEAVELVDLGAAIAVETQQELDAILIKMLFSESETRELAGQMAWRYCESKQGASQIVIQYIQASLQEG